MTDFNDVYIVAAGRSAIGSFGGSLSETPAQQMLTPVLQAVIQSSGVAAQQVQSLVLGHVMHSSARDPYLARQCALEAGLQSSSTAVSINRLCGSSLQAIIEQVMAIRLGDIQIGLAAGVESMSRAPYLDTARRWGSKMGDGQLEDMLLGPLTDPFGHGHMGETAENVAETFAIERTAMDQLALASHQRAAAAIKAGYFETQIVPLTVQKGRKSLEFKQDEHVRADVSLEKLASLKPAFRDLGKVTAGNASGINDAAAALLLCDAATVESLALKPLARVLAYGHSGVEPRIMGIGPVAASQQALQRAGIAVADLDVIESNEAFAAQACAVSNQLQLDDDLVNPNGGAIALGHPIGATGAIITTKLVHELQRRQARYGLATLCIGGGQGVALVVESLP